MKVLAGTDIPIRLCVFHMCLQFQPKDAWIGLYVESVQPFRAYLCLVPFFPIHIKIEKAF